MSADTPSASSGGIGLFGLLTLIFVTLKLLGERFPTEVATWSWWWVLSPLWLPACILIAFLVIMWIVFTIYYYLIS